MLHDSQQHSSETSSKSGRSLNWNNMYIDDPNYKKSLYDKMKLNSSQITICMINSLTSSYSEIKNIW